MEEQKLCAANCGDSSATGIMCENGHRTCDGCFAGQRRCLNYAVLQCAQCRAAFEGFTEIRNLQLSEEEVEQRAINVMASQVTFDSDAETVLPDPEPHMEASYAPSVVEVDSQGEAVDGHFASEVAEEKQVMEQQQPPATSPVPDPPLQSENWVFVPAITPRVRRGRRATPQAPRRRGIVRRRTPSPVVAEAVAVAPVRVIRLRSGEYVFTRESADGVEQELSREELREIPNVVDTASPAVLRAMAQAWLHQ